MNCLPTFSTICLHLQLSWVYGTLQNRKGLQPPRHRYEGMPGCCPHASFIWRPFAFGATSFSFMASTGAASIIITWKWGLLHPAIDNVDASGGSLEWPAYQNKLLHAFLNQTHDAFELTCLLFPFSCLTESLTTFLIPTFPRWINGIFFAAILWSVQSSEIHLPIG